ncbi:MAG: methyltransferase domain-containing protein [bacterium]
MNLEIQRKWARQTFRGVGIVTNTSNRLNLPIISTGRPFAFYREVFFKNRPEADVLSDLKGQRVLDVGCGLTPYTQDSMFQACYRDGVEFYGIDPKLNGTFEFGTFDRLKVFFTGGTRLDPYAPGAERRLAIYADDLPFEDASVDLILSSWALFVWIADEQVLDRVFAEFARVLKIGGEVRVYPTLHADDVTWPMAKETLAAFDIRQRFVGRASVLNLPPAFMTRFVRRDA